MGAPFLGQHQQDGQAAKAHRAQRAASQPYPSDAGVLQVSAKHHEDICPVKLAAYFLLSFTGIAIEFDPFKRRQNPHVENVEKVARRIRGDLAFVDRVLLAPPPAAAPVSTSEGETSPSHCTSQPKLSLGSATPPEGLSGDQSYASHVHQPQATVASAIAPSSSPAEYARIQGIVNNLRGFEGELMAARLAPGVISLAKRFPARDVAPLTGKETLRNTGAISSPPADAAAPSHPTSVEVDVVAQGGSSWIEVSCPVDT